MMNLKLNYLLFTLVALFAGSCGYEDLPTQNVTKTPAPAQNGSGLTVYKKKETTHYNYRGDKFRDPFVPLNGEGFNTSSLSDEVAVPNLASLSLKGIFDDGKIKMALISGGGVNYILKGTHLYDNRQRLVRGISGVIKSESVLMIAPDKTTKEIKLKAK